MARIKEVARLAQVSAASVSRYLNTPHLLSAETKIRIEKAIEELEYVPSQIATSMRTKKTKNLALIIPSISNMYYADLYAAIRNIILNKGYMVDLYTTERDPQTLVKYLKEIPHRQFDGVIIGYLDEPELTPELEIAQEKFPLVLITSDPKREKFNNVFYDAKDGIFKATNHLIQIGRKNIAFVSGRRETIVAQEKYSGYAMAMMKAGLEIKPEYVHFGESNHFRTGFMAVREFVNLPVMPDGIVCIIDDIAIGCIKYLLTNGYKVPQDVSVIGFNGMEILETFEPSISTIQQPVQAIAESAVELLIGNIDYPRSRKRQYIYTGTLVTRNSTVLQKTDRISLRM
jgi:LacI family repressor for deo operon, udp, cdd, tsx, nupC, and nupG